MEGIWPGVGNADVGQTLAAVKPEHTAAMATETQARM